MVSQEKIDEDKKQVMVAYLFLRRHNTTIPDDILILMRDSALKELKRQEEYIDFLCNMSKYD